MLKNTVTFMGYVVWALNRIKFDYKGFPFMSRILQAALAARPSFSDFNISAGEPLTVGRIRIEILAGLTVALALVPEAVALQVCIHWSAYMLHLLSV
jgi:MFS superfamily sulfate permease-like transporter